MKRTLKLVIGGMRCEQCVASIEETLLGISGVLSCEVRVGAAVVTFDDHDVTRQELFAGVRGAGAFEVTGFSSEDI